MKTHLSKPAQGRAKYTAEYKKKAVALRRNSGIESYSDGWSKVSSGLPMKHPTI